MSYPAKWTPSDGSWQTSATGNRSAWGASPPRARGGQSASTAGSNGQARGAGSAGEPGNAAPASPSQPAAATIPSTMPAAQPSPAPARPADPLKLVTMGLKWDGAARTVSGDLVLATEAGRVISMDCCLDGRVTGSTCEGDREVAYGEWDMPAGLDLPGSIMHLRKLADRIAWVGADRPAGAASSPESERPA
jgi:hypothetical protein